VRIVYKVYNVCDSDSAVFQYFDDNVKTFTVLSVNGLWTAPNTYSSTPSWFTSYNDGFGNYSSWLFVPSAVPTGSFPISYSGTDGNEYLIVINKTATCSDYSFANKCCDSTNIVWVNTLGGYENYIFGGVRKVLELNEGDSDTFKTQDLTLKNSQLQNIYDTVIVNTGNIPLSHLTKLKSLRNSIQAWHYNESLPSYYEWASRFTPIILDREGMILSDTKEKIIERSVRFRIAKEINIQSQ
jgi:hypothetical protein